MLGKFIKHNHIFLTFLFLSIGSFLIYNFVSSNPTPRYDHYLYLAKNFLLTRVDVPDLPSWYHDVVNFNGHKFLPFPPAPAVVIIPFLAIFQNITQQQISLIIGAINVGLIYLLTKKFVNPKTATIVAVFYALGTVAFWTTVVGTTWYFAHTVGVMFLTFSLILHFSKKDYLAGLCFALAVLCRYPIALGGVFFLLQYRKDLPRLIHFLLGALIFLPIHFTYNWVRFGSINEMGYLDLYKMYATQGYEYSFIRVIRPQWPHFGYLDLRNIPLHLITLLVLPPIITERFQIQPSPFGLGLLFACPLLLLALIPNWKNSLQRNLWIGAAAIAFAEFLHYAQGWVQFGYRFLLDFIPFLLILLAIKFKFNKCYIALLIISILVNFWGVSWGIKLGW